MSRGLVRPLRRQNAHRLFTRHFPGDRLPRRAQRLAGLSSVQTGAHWTYQRRPRTARFDVAQGSRKGRLALRTRGLCLARQPRLGSRRQNLIRNGGSHATRNGKKRASARGAQGSLSAFSTVRSSSSVNSSDSNPLFPISVSA